MAVFVQPGSQLRWSSMKALTGSILAWLALAVPNADAQDATQYIGDLRYICRSMIENDMNGDIVAASRELPSVDKICDCADARMADDPVVRKMVSLTKEQRRRMPKASQRSVYVTVKYYSASLACYADAVSKSADKIMPIDPASGVNAMAADAMLKSGNAEILKNNYEAAMLHCKRGVDALGEAYSGEGVLDDTTQKLIAASIQAREGRKMNAASAYCRILEERLLLNAKKRNPGQRGNEHS
jgi:hypothetical protein